MERKTWGEVAGQEVELFTLDLGEGNKAEISTFGAAIVNLYVLDKQGKAVDVSLGYDNVQDYVNCSKFFGVAVGRHANRIGGAEFTLNGKSYKLAANEGKNNLHGGPGGFSKRIWKPEVMETEQGEALKLTYFSPDGEEGFPGNLQVEIVYAPTGTGGLSMTYTATSDQDTVVNLTNHAYFNLAGHDQGSILDHELEIYADLYTPIDAELLPTGEILKVEGTPMDFRAKTAMGANIDSDHEQIRYGGGFDHNWVVRRTEPGLVKAARAEDPKTGRVLEVYTTKPGIQFYSGNFLDGGIGKGGVSYAKRSGFCLETQFFPNSTRHLHFPSPVLRAGERYAHSTIYQFSAE